MYVRKRRRPVSEINVVPYIDVMLVLLIIFMVTAPLISQGVKVDLPKASANPIEQEELRELGFEQDTLMEQSIAFVVKHVEMHNYAPARFNQLLSIETRVVELKGASMTFQQIIKNEQGVTLVSGDIKVACVDLAVMKPKRLPRTLLGEISRVI